MCSGSSCPGVPPEEAARHSEAQDEGRNRACSSVLLALKGIIKIRTCKSRALFPVHVDVQIVDANGEEVLPLSEFDLASPAAGKKRRQLLRAAGGGSSGKGSTTSSGSSNNDNDNNQ